MAVGYMMRVRGIMIAARIMRSLIFAYIDQVGRNSGSIDKGRVFMRIDVLGYLKMKIAPVLYRCAAEARSSRTRKIVRLSVKKPDEVPVLRSHSDDKIKSDHCSPD